MTPPLLEVRGLARTYRLPAKSFFAPRGALHAVTGVSFAIPAGESLGIVGESGSGKSTLARLVMMLERPDAGTVIFAGEDLTQMAADALRARRRQFQMVFQDPYGSLDPRLPVSAIVSEPLAIAEPALGLAERRDRVLACLDEVGLSGDILRRYPHEFSGGQRQRIALARALITRPKLIVADEPVSALDLSIQAQVLNLMSELKARLGISYLFISHNLAVVEHVAERVAVMYRGAIVEAGPTDAVFSAPAHPYTQALVDAVPRLDQAGGALRPSLPSEGAPAPETGCVFAARCPQARPGCQSSIPALTHQADGRMVACHFPLTPIRP